MPFNAIHRLEVLNAFELLVGRRVVSSHECRAILRQLDDDVESQRLTRTALDLEQVLADARELSRRFTARFLTRSLALRHVAAAHLALCETFVSADDRQLVVAKASGLSTIDITRSPRRRRR